VISEAIVNLERRQVTESTARLLAVFVVDSQDTNLTIIETQKIYDKSTMLR
jgi:hypothetical protein